MIEMGNGRAFKIDLVPSSFNLRTGRNSVGIMTRYSKSIGHLIAGRAKKPVTSNPVFTDLFINLAKVHHLHQSPGRPRADSHISFHADDGPE